ncbi:unnamed protein product [Brassica napus]|nr:unnamed protein product [Brassica napus]
MDVPLFPHLLLPLQTWCVAKPSSDQATLLDNINYACSHVDCRLLSSGYPCYSPNNLINHASIPMNLYYQANGRNYWNFTNSGLIVITNPSYGNCYYEYTCQQLSVFLVRTSKVTLSPTTFNDFCLEKELNRSTDSLTVMVTLPGATRPLTAKKVLYVKHTPQFPYQEPSGL